MSDGNEFRRSDAATGNVRRPTVVSRNDGTSSWCDDADQVGDTSQLIRVWWRETTTGLFSFPSLLLTH